MLGVLLWERPVLPLLAFWDRTVTVHGEVMWTLKCCTDSRCPGNVGPSFHSLAGTGQWLGVPG